MSNGITNIAMSFDLNDTPVALNLEIHDEKSKINKDIKISFTASNGDDTCLCENNKKLMKVRKEALAHLTNCLADTLTEELEEMKKEKIKIDIQKSLISHYEELIKTFEEDREELKEEIKQLKEERFSKTDYERVVAEKEDYKSRYFKLKEES